jgi:NTP pyrophosphatase (non-canonical NTP hydrolase)
MMAMTIKEAQEAVDNWIRTYGVRYFSELTNMAVLTEEVGEVARIMSRRYGDQSFKEGENPDALAGELADVLWVLLCIANQTGVDMTEAFKATIEKKTSRDHDRHRNNEKLK